MFRILDSAKEVNKWEEVAAQEFITARLMIIILVSLATIIQIPFFYMASIWGLETFSFMWWMLQFFGFVMATNLGAVILAIIAQDSATKIGEIQTQAFTAEFMEGVETLTKILSVFTQTAQEEDESLFTPEERSEMLLEICKEKENVKVKSFEGLLVDFASSESVNAIVKGLRAMTDFDYEFQMAQANSTLKGYETIFIPSSPEYGYLSSSMVKEIHSYGGDIKSLVPEYVLERMNNV